MSLRSFSARLEALERQQDQSRPAAKHEQRSWALERVLRMHENHHRAQQGLEPLPLVRSPEEGGLEMAALEHSLAVTIPSYRASLGWQSAGCRAFLDRWEEETREKLKKGVVPG